MPDQIFISYRRNDAAYVTGHINDLLRKEFGDEAVFTDVDNIALGVDFRKVIDETVSQCQVFLAVIGTEWLTARDQEGNARLEDPADFVRIEIESALKRNIPVIPLLVSGAQMPTAEDLPDSLKDLAFRNGTPIRPAPDFSADMARLIKNLRRHFEAVRITTSGPAPVAEEKPAEPAARTPAPKPARPKQTKAPGVRVQVADDERVRKQAELGIGESKKSGRGGLIWVAAVIILAGTGWFYVDRNPGVIDEVMRAVESTPDGNGDVADPLSDPAAADVTAPTSFSPATIADSPVESETGLADGVAVEVVTDVEPGAAMTPDEESDPAMETAESPAEEAAGVVTSAAPGAEADEPADSATMMEVAEPAVESMAEGGDSTATDAPAAETSVVEASTDSEIDDEITMTPGSQRQMDASELISEGVRLAGIGDHEAAIQNFDDALELEVEPAFLFKQRGASYQALGQYDAAVADYSEAINLNSEDVNAYYNRGASNMALQNYADAVADYDVVIQFDPEFVDAYSRRADAHEALGNAAEAARDRATVQVFENNRDNPR